jgi:hypothetical protein
MQQKSGFVSLLNVLSSFGIAAPIRQCSVLGTMRDSARWGRSMLLNLVRHIRNPEVRRTVILAAVQTGTASQRENIVVPLYGGITVPAKNVGVAIPRRGQHQKGKIRLFA